jgi:insecticidal toxin complex protein TccC
MLAVERRPKYRLVNGRWQRRINQHEEESPQSAYLERLLTGIRTGDALPEMPFQEAFQQVANDENLVIGIREPNPLGASLLRDGYASKSFHIKAKSSVSGPTAGFVAADPAFGKLGRKGADKQREYIDSAIKDGAGRVPLRLSDKRVEELINLNLMKWDTPDKVSACYGEDTHSFTMRRDDDSPDLPWAVFHDTGEPVRILSNPKGLGGPDGPKSAVTADYDLFGLFPHVNLANNARPINPVARLVGRNKAGIEELANAYLNRIRLSGREPDPDSADLGNFHHYGKTIKNALKRRIEQLGYTGGLLVHHGDESSNPYSPGQDFPLRFVAPNKPAMLVENNKQLQNAYEWFRKLGYSVDINPAFSFSSDDLPRSLGPTEF